TIYSMSPTWQLASDSQAKQTSEAERILFLSRGAFADNVSDEEFKAAANELGYTEKQRQEIREKGYSKFKTDALWDNPSLSSLDGGTAVALTADALLLAVGGGALKATKMPSMLSKSRIAAPLAKAGEFTTQHWGKMSSALALANYGRYEYYTDPDEKTMEGRLSSAAAGFLALPTFLAAKNLSPYLIRGIRGTGSSVGGGYARGAGISLATSTALSGVNLYNSVEIGKDSEGNSIYAPYLSGSFGAAGALIENTVLLPGTNMILAGSRASNLGQYFGAPSEWNQFNEDFQNNIMAMQTASLRTYIDTINKTGDLALILSSPLYVGEFLSVATGATQVLALSDPVKTGKGLLEMVDLIKEGDFNRIVGKAEGEKAQAGDFGAIGFKLAGAVKGYRTLGREVIPQRFNSPNKPGSPVSLVGSRKKDYIVSVEKSINGKTELLYSELPFSSKAGHFLARSHDSAGTMAQVNTVLGLAMPTLNSDSETALLESAYALSTQMTDNLSSAYLLSLAGLGYGAAVGRMGNTALVRNFAQRPMVSKALANPFATSAGLMAIGGTSYFGSEYYLDSYAGGKDSHFTNAGGLFGLVLMGAGLRVGGYGLRNVLAKSPRVKEILGDEIKGFTKENVIHNTAYGLGGVSIGVLAIETGMISGGLNALGFEKAAKAFDSENMDTDDRVYSLLAAAALGIKARRLNSGIPFAAEVAGDSALLWAAKQGVYEPTMLAIENGLDIHKEGLRSFAEISHPFFGVRAVKEFKDAAEKLSPEDQQKMLAFLENARKDGRLEDVLRDKGLLGGEGTKAQRKNAKDFATNLSKLLENIDAADSATLNRIIKGKVDSKEWNKLVFEGKSLEQKKEMAKLKAAEEILRNPSTGYLIDPTTITEEGIQESKYFYGQSYEFVKEGDSGHYDYSSPKTTSGLGSATMLGVFGRAAVKGGKTGYKAYMEGAPTAAKGAGEGLRQAKETFFKGQAKDAYEFAKASPHVANAGTAAAGLGSIVLYNELSKDGNPSALMLAGGALLLAVPSIATAAGKRGWIKPGQVIENSFYREASAQAFTGAKVLAADFVGRTAVNLTTVIAPLMGVIEGASYLADTAMLPSANSEAERYLINNIFGAFYVSPEEAYHQGDMSLATRTKFDSGGLLTEFDRAQTVSDILSSSASIAGRAYLGGLYGVWQRADLEKLSDDDLNKIATQRGLSGSREFKINTLAGTAKVERMFSKFSPKLVSWDEGLVNLDEVEFDETFAANYVKPDETAVGFSAALTVLMPVAEPVLSNIKTGNIGRKFQATQEGFTAGLETMLPGTYLKKAAKADPTKWETIKQRVSDLTFGGTFEEMVPENIIDTAFLNFVPFSAFMSPDSAMQTKEVLQELFGKGPHMRKLSSDEAVRIWRNGGRFIGAKLDQSFERSGVAAERVQQIIETVQGKTWNEVQNNPEILKELGESLHIGDQIIMDEGGYWRNITISDGQEFNKRFAVEAKAIEFERKQMNRADLIKTAQRSGNQPAEIESEAAKKLLARQFDLTKEENQKAFLATAAQEGEILISDVRQSAQNGDMRVRLSLQDVLQEQLALGGAQSQTILGQLRNKTGKEVFEWINNLTESNPQWLGSGYYYLPNQGKSKNGEIFKSRLARQFREKNIDSTIEVLAQNAQFLATGNEFHAEMAQYAGMESQNTNQQFAREEFYASAGLEDLGTFGRGITAAGYYTIGKIADLDKVKVGRKVEVNKDGSETVKKEGREIFKSIGVGAVAQKIMPSYTAQLKQVLQERLGDSSHINRQIDMINQEIGKLERKEMDVQERNDKKKEYEKKKKELRNMLDTRVSIAKAAETRFEMQQEYSRRGKYAGGLTASMAIALLKNPNSRFIRNDFTQEARTQLIGELSKLEEYDTRSVANKLAKALDSDAIFSDENGKHSGKQLVLSIFKNKEFADEMDRVIPDIYRIAEHGSIKNEATGAVVSAQNQGSKGVAIDVVMNFQFEEKNGQIDVAPNFVGGYNAGEYGAHEIFHYLVAQMNTNPEMRDRIIENIDEQKFPEFKAILTNFTQAKHRHTGTASSLEIDNIDLTQTEEGDHEAIARYLSDVMAIRTIQERRQQNRMDWQYQNEGTEHFIRMLNRSHVDADERGIMATYDALDQNDASRPNFMQAVYNNVLGSQWESYVDPVKEAKARFEDEVAQRIHRRAMDMVGKKVGGFEKEADVLNFYEDAVASISRDRNVRNEFEQLADAMGVAPTAATQTLDKVRVVRTLSSVARGVDTSVTDSAPKGRGRSIKTGDALNVDVVLRAGDDGIRDASSTWFVNKNKGLNEINFIKSEEGLALKSKKQFSQELDQMGLASTKKEGYLALYDAYDILFSKLKVAMTMDGPRRKKYEELFSEVAAEFAQKQPKYAQYVNSQRIHDLFGSDKIHSFETGHVKGRGELEGFVNINDGINLEPFIAIPGVEGFRKNVQVRLDPKAIEAASLFKKSGKVGPIPHNNPPTKKIDSPNFPIMQQDARIPVDKVQVTKADNQGPLDYTKGEVKFSQPSSQDAFLQPQDRVLVLDVGGEVKFYPTKIIGQHEVVNDTIAGQEVVVIYSPDNFAAAAHLSQGRKLAPSGLRYQGTALLYDEETKSLWSPLAHEAVAGPKAKEGQKMQALPLEHLTYEQAKAVYAGRDIQVMTPETGHQENYSKDTAPNLYYAAKGKERALLAQMGQPLDYDLVAGVVVDGHAKAYMVGALKQKARNQGSLRFKDKIGTKIIQVEYDEEFDRIRVSDEAGNVLPIMDKTFLSSFNRYYPDAQISFGPVIEGERITLADVEQMRNQDILGLQTSLNSQPLRFYPDRGETIEQAMAGQILQDKRDYEEIGVREMYGLSDEIKKEERSYQWQNPIPNPWGVRQETGEQEGSITPPSPQIGGYQEEVSINRKLTNNEEPKDLTQRSSNIPAIIQAQQQKAIQVAVREGVRPTADPIDIEAKRVRVTNLKNLADDARENKRSSYGLLENRVKDIEVKNHAFANDGLLSLEETRQILADGMNGRFVNDQWMFEVEDTGTEQNLFTPAQVRRHVDVGIIQGFVENGVRKFVWNSQIAEKIKSGPQIAVRNGDKPKVDSLDVEQRRISVSNMKDLLIITTTEGHETVGLLQQEVQKLEKEKQAFTENGLLSNEESQQLIADGMNGRFIGGSWLFEVKNVDQGVGKYFSSEEINNGLELGLIQGVVSNGIRQFEWNTEIAARIREQNKFEESSQVAAAKPQSQAPPVEEQKRIFPPQQVPQLPHRMSNTSLLPTLPLALPTTPFVKTSRLNRPSQFKADPERFNQTQQEQRGLVRLANVVDRLGQRVQQTETMTKDSSNSVLLAQQDQLTSAERSFARAYANYIKSFVPENNTQNEQVHQQRMVDINQQLMTQPRQGFNVIETPFGRKVKYDAAQPMNLTRLFYADLVADEIEQEFDVEIDGLDMTPAEMGAPIARVVQTSGFDKQLKTLESQYFVQMDSRMIKNPTDVVRRLKGQSVEQYTYTQQQQAVREKWSMLGIEESLDGEENIARQVTGSLGKSFRKVSGKIQGEESGLMAVDIFESPLTFAEEFEKPKTNFITIDPSSMKPSQLVQAQTTPAPTRAGQQFSLFSKTERETVEPIVEIPKANRDSIQGQLDLFDDAPAKTGILPPPTTPEWQGPLLPKVQQSQTTPATTPSVEAPLKPWQQPLTVPPMPILNFTKQDVLDSWNAAKQKVSGAWEGTKRTAGAIWESTPSVPAKGSLAKKAAVLSVAALGLSVPAFEEDISVSPKPVLTKQQYDYQLSDLASRTGDVVEEQRYLRRAGVSLEDRRWAHFKATETIPAYNFNIPTGSQRPQNAILTDMADVLVKGSRKTRDKKGIVVEEKKLTDLGAELVVNAIENRRLENVEIAKIPTFLADSNRNIAGMPFMSLRNIGGLDDAQAAKVQQTMVSLAYKSPGAFASAGDLEKALITNGISSLTAKKATQENVLTDISFNLRKGENSAVQALPAMINAYQMMAQEDLASDIGRYALPRIAASSKQDKQISFKKQLEKRINARQERNVVKGEQQDSQIISLKKALDLFNKGRYSNALSVYNNEYLPIARGEAADAILQLAGEDASAFSSVENFNKGLQSVGIPKDVSQALSRPSVVQKISQVQPGDELALKELQSKVVAYVTPLRTDVTKAFQKRGHAFSVEHIYLADALASLAQTTPKVFGDIETLRQAVQVNNPNISAQVVEIAVNEDFLKNIALAEYDVRGVYLPSQLLHYGETSGSREFHDREVAFIKPILKGMGFENVHYTQAHFDDPNMDGFMKVLEPTPGHDTDKTNSAIQSHFGLGGSGISVTELSALKTLVDSNAGDFAQGIERGTPELIRRARIHTPDLQAVAVGPGHGGDVEKIAYQKENGDLSSGAGFEVRGKIPFVESLKAKLDAREVLQHVASSQENPISAIVYKAENQPLPLRKDAPARLSKFDLKAHYRTAGKHEGFDLA
ncbi:MAG: DUF3179 domain-containing protein, partial [Candidatus Omnitrophica bacterium]|nr:DUF3179 domain-containing protein [Candidatus Omnitrophota bacterium]